jgi:hypothetical protein
MMEALSSCETSFLTRVTRLNLPEDGILVYHSTFTQNLILTKVTTEATMKQDFTDTEDGGLENAPAIITLHPPRPLRVSCLCAAHSLVIVCSYGRQKDNKTKDL